MAEEGDKLILLDWDDTLCPSTWMIEEGFSLHSHPVELVTSWNDLHKLSQKVEMVLKKVKSLGSPYILTNSQDGWVTQSTNLLFPSLGKTLKTVPIYSANSKFSSYDPNPKMWKHYAVRDLLETHDPVTIFGAGDAENDQEAVLFNRFTDDYTEDRHSVKFKLQPTLEDLFLQLDYLEFYLEDVFSN